MILLPTRGRPEDFWAFVDGYHDCRSTAPVAVYLDDDDSTRATYAVEKLPAHWHVHTGPRLGLGSAVNAMVAAHPDAPWYGLANDDMIPRTVAWDQELGEACGTNRVAYPDDMLQRTVTFPWVGGNLVRALGWWAIPGLHHFYVDTFWGDIAAAMGRLISRPDIKVEHRHHTLSGIVDETTRGRGRVAADEMGYMVWRTHAWQPTLTLLEGVA